MCIAIAKYKGIKLPTKEILKKCWNNNPDGAGFMYNDGENVTIHKGFMKFKTFYKYLMKIDSQENLTDKDVVIHFRIATSGKVDQACTHPFPITHNIEDMRKIAVRCKYGFAHNGIISGYGTKEYSDTMHYIANVISNIHDLEHSEDLIHALATENSSRFAVLTGDDMLLGGAWVEDNDIYYSNSSYKDSYYISTKWDKWDKLDKYEADYYKELYKDEDERDAKHCRCDWCYAKIPVEDAEWVDDGYEQSILCPECYVDYQRWYGKDGLYSK